MISKNQRKRTQMQGIRGLHIADFLLLMATLFGTLVVRFGTSWPKSFSTYLVGFLLATSIHLTIYYFGELYEPTPRLGARLWLPRISALTTVAILTDSTLALSTGYFLMPRGNLILFGIFGSLGITFNRWLSRKFRTRRYGNPRVLLAGSDEDIELGEEHLLTCEPDIVVVGSTRDLNDLSKNIESTDATDVLLMSPGGLANIYPEPLAELELKRIGMFQRVIPSDTLLGLKRSRQIAGMPFIALKAHSLSPSRSTLKRILETAYLLIAAIPLTIISLFVASYIRALAGRNIIYRQERVGKFGVHFNMLKFRTMGENAESQTGVIKANQQDSRVLPGLNWIRRTRLDELPQFINVAKGEMSIIGPRPERPDFTKEYERAIPGYGRRHDIPPGITGLAQVNGRYHTDPSYKLGHDLQYLVNWSPILDVQILFQTVWIVLSRRL